MCPIGWHEYQWPWVTLNVSLAVLNLSNSYSSISMTRINYAVCIHEWESIYGFNRNCLPKMKDFSMLGLLQALTYTVKVVVSEKLCKTDTLYTPLVPFGQSICAIFNDLEWPWMSFDCCSVCQMQYDEHLCDISHGFNWHGASRGPSAIAELLVLSVGDT